MSGQRPWGPHSTKNQTLRKVPFQFLPRVYELNRRDRLNSVGFDTGDDHREEARMRHFFGTSLFVAIMLAFQAIEPSSGGEPIAGHFAVAAGEKMGNPLFNEGAMVCPDMQTVQLAVQAITRHRADLLKQRRTGTDGSPVQPPSPGPNPASFGCTIVPNGTRVFVERFVLPFVPLIIVDVDGSVTIRGVTLSTMVN